ncbi:unnamed protein product [Triticum turgidum subsp. durum]|uniref:Uncharacterized protein n=1 Tax=Triticum turgidum subsp. durum TaxID=4567 RepID=A0A9R1RFW4_TRITD|nr:unnamed protein product [Triticum turgidum subsp. durum]
MEAAGDEERPLLHHPHPHLYQDGNSRYTSDGTVDVDGQPAVKASTGDWRACFFVLGIQFSECLAFFAISKNLVTYLTSVLHESNIDAARNVSTWIGTTFFTPLVGAFLADTYWGRYKTLVVFLSVYALGMLVLTVSTTLPWMRQSSSNDEIHRIAVYTGLYLTALGNGGIKPCTSTFGADQFDITVFIAGRRIYRYKTLGESPMTRVSQVVVAAARNHHMDLPDDCSTLHHLPSAPLEATFNVHHTTQFRFLDKAAIVPAPTVEKKGTSTSPWRLCVVSHVEEVKMLLRLCPTWASLVIFFMIMSQMSSTVIEQGMIMDNRVGPFVVPPASIASFTVVTTLVLVPIYDMVLVPLARHATGEDRGLTQSQRLGIGFAMSTLCMAYLALLERNRLAVAATGEMMNIMWQAPAYVVLGAGEVFTVIGMLELFYDRSPDGMRSLCTALSQLAVAVGNYLNSAVLGVVASTTVWISEDLDKGHLDYFFWTMAALGALNLLQFLFFSMRYNDNTACRQRHPY